MDPELGGNSSPRLHWGTLSFTRTTSHSNTIHGDHDQPDPDTCSSNDTLNAASDSPSAGIIATNPAVLPMPRMNTINYALNQGVDRQTRSLNDIPQNLLDRARDFPQVSGYAKLSPMGQANVLILQLADRLHRVEERLQRMEEARQQRDIQETVSS